MENMRVIIIGAGAAGLFAGCALRQKGIEAVLLERNDKPGRKLYITGKGRCNFTNSCDERDFLKNVVVNPKFLTSAIYGFSPSDCIDFFTDRGLSSKVERGNRVFPSSDKSSDVIKALSKGLDIRFNEYCESLNTENGVVKSVTTGRGTYPCDAVIMATGGCSYPLTGSDGNGWKIAEALGHSVVSPVAALCPILTDETAARMQGLSLKNVTLSLIKDGVAVRSVFGEMLFTDSGVSGPVALTLSSYINRTDLKDAELSVDFKPALGDSKLDERLLRDFEENRNKNFENILPLLLPKSCIGVFLKRLGIPPYLKVNSVTKEERRKLVSLLKDFRLKVVGLAPVEEGIVTSGGVCVKEIDPKTMQSKIVSGLYFAGEMIDVDALTGGYNLQIAFSTAMAAVNDIYKRVNLC